MAAGSIRAIGPIGERTLSFGRATNALFDAAAAEGSGVGGSFFVHPETLPRKSAVSATDTKVRELIRASSTTGRPVALPAHQKEGAWGRGAHHALRPVGCNP